MFNMGDIIRFKPWEEVGEIVRHAGIPRHVQPLFDGEHKFVVTYCERNGFYINTPEGDYAYIYPYECAEKADNRNVITGSFAISELRDLGLYAGEYVIEVSEDSRHWNEFAGYKGKVVFASINNAFNTAGEGIIRVTIMSSMRNINVPVDLLVERELYPEDYTEPVMDFYTERCGRCGRTFVTKLTEYNLLPEEDALLCPDCRKRDFVLPYHRYSPQLHFWSLPKDDCLFLGAEIEVDEGGETDREARKVVKMMNPTPDWFMYCSHDGSLHSGFEMITCPATLAYHKSKKEEYKKLFNMLIQDGYLAHNTSTCGLHVHFSREFFADGGDEEKNVCKLLYLVEKFWNELVVFSRRDYRSLDRFAKKTDRNVRDFYQRWNKTEDHEGHYYAVNITNSETIEMRMFRGTLSLKTYLATLSFVDRIARVAKEHSVEELQRMTFMDLLPRDAAAYYRNRVSSISWDELPTNVEGVVTPPRTSEILMPF